jgi:hypothetical protein
MKSSPLELYVLLAGQFKFYLAMTILKSKVKSLPSGEIHPR